MGMRHIVLFLVGVAFACGGSAWAQPDPQTKARQEALLNCRATYHGPPRIGERMDIHKLIAQLVQLKADHYNFLIHKEDSDWEDLQLFLPVAKEKGIKVWVSVAPPSKPGGRFSFPFQQDYVRWAQELARLSLTHANLVAWGMDDFSHNEQVFTRPYTVQVIEGARQVNPKLAFVPTVYYKHATRPAFAQTYVGLFDGILFPYRAESGGRDLIDFTRVGDEVRRLRELLPGTIVVLDVYSSRHSELGESTPDYVRQVMAAGKQHADGVTVYRHPEPGTPKWHIVEELFHQWAR